MLGVAEGAALLREHHTKPGVAWSFRTCANSGSNISHLLSHPRVRPWLAYGPVPWRAWMQSLDYCAMPMNGVFRKPLGCVHGTDEHGVPCASAESVWHRADGTDTGATPNERRAIENALTTERAESAKSRSKSTLWHSLLSSLRYSPPPPPRSPPPPPPPPPSPPTRRPGVWHDEKTWAPKDVANYHWFSRAEVLRLLSGRVLVFEGDSMTRQIFVRLVWWIRGLPVMVEHYFKSSATYSFNATHDDLSFNELVLDRKRPLAGQAVLVYRYYTRRGPEDSRYCGVMESGAIAGVLTGNLESVILRWPPHHHWQRKHNTTRVARCKRCPCPGAPTSDSPWLEEMFNSKEMLNDGGAPHFFSRNFWCVGDDGERCTTDSNHHVDSFGEFQRNKQRDIHFECGFNPMFPNRIQSWKMPENGDCSATLSLNVGMAVLNRLAGAMQVPMQEH